MKIALYKNLKYNYEAVAEVQPCYESNPEYVRISVISDIEFEMLENVDLINAKVSALRNEQQNIRAESYAQIERLEDEIHKLLCIEHKGQ